MSARPGALDLPALPGSLLLPMLPGALCKGADPGLWFPRPGGSMDKAKAVCRACPARVPCLNWAVQADERAGVWGGTAPDERARLRRDRRPAGALAVSEPGVGLGVTVVSQDSPAS